ncbi:hypothetical protein [Gemmatimonas sp.]|uniref:hypothetical protein n=1 Tax=Gemmatimonas sp. TaxID=1962908 RepID=UPI0025BFBD84|nr:hypothetical protein [Gemmatimonas sp.]MCA2991940.1 hypothetical protein [Gemmatimonas sp.]
MSFFRSFERKVLRPAGRGLRAAAPIIGAVAGSAIPGLGTIAGSALGSAIGGQVKRGKFDGGRLLRDAGVGVLTGGVMSKLGGAGSLLGGGKTDALNSLAPMNAASKIGITGMGKAAGQSFDDVARALAPQAAQGGIRSAIGNALGDGRTIKALGEAAIGGYGAVQNERMMRQQREQMERQNRIEDEERARRQAMDPARAALLAEIFRRMGMTQQGVVS